MEKKRTDLVFGKELFRAPGNRIRVLSIREIEAGSWRVVGTEAYDRLGAPGWVRNTSQS